MNGSIFDPKTGHFKMCHWSTAAPAGLADAAEGWGMDKLEEVFVRAHRGFKSHDDGNGKCKVCGAAIDFEAWLDAQDAVEIRERREQTTHGRYPAL